MKRSARRIDELRHFFLAENGGQAMSLFRIGSVGNAPRLLQGLDVEKPQGTQMGRHRTGRQLPLCEEMSLGLPNVLRPQTRGGALEISSESLDLARARPWGSVRGKTARAF